MTEKLIKREASNYILETSREYSIYVCENRAIPRICDGLKDAQRKALWLMRNRADKIKTISLAGEMISSNLYVHGDQSAAGAISLLAAPYNNNVPLFNGIGTFGTRIAPKDGIAAPRYTYIKRNKFSEDVMLPDLAIVPLKDNYDGSVKEPEHFLPLVPTVLLNGISGIAVGWATEILPRSFKQVLEATIAVVEGKEIRKMKPTYSYLDCPVVNVEGYSWEIFGRVKINDLSTVSVIELPPDVSLEKFKDRLNNLEDEDKIKGYTDHSTDHINVEIKFARGYCKDKTETHFVDLLKLKQRKTENMVVIDWNGTSIKKYESTTDIVKDFVDWRLGFYTTRYNKMLADDEYELNFWEGVKKCFVNKLTEKLGAGVPNKETLEKIVVKLTSGTALDEKQIDRIVSLPTYRWNKEFFEEVKKKITELEKNIKYYKSLLKSKTKIRQVYLDELENLRKYAK